MGGELRKIPQRGGVGRKILVERGGSIRGQLIPEGGGLDNTVEHTLSIF